VVITDFADIYVSHLTMGRETSARIGFAQLPGPDPFVPAFRQRYTECNRPAAQDLLWGRIETTSCAVDAEGHLNATVIVEVVNTFSSFQVP
jgi:hypothetical protein